MLLIRLATVEACVFVMEVVHAVGFARVERSEDCLE